MNPDRTLPWDWYPGRVPENVFVHEQAYLETTYSFELFQSRAPRAIERTGGLNQPAPGHASEHLWVRKQELREPTRTAKWDGY